MMDRDKLIKLILSFLICYSVVGFVYLFLKPVEMAKQWSFIELPPFYPSDFFYVITWPVLLALMSVSLYLIWRNGFGNDRVQTCMLIFFLHLSLLAVWLYLFANLANVVLVFGTYICIILAIFCTIFFFLRVSWLAAVLLLPVAFIHVTGMYFFVMLTILNPELLSM